ncbi:MAG: glycosyltransferase family 2 protein [Actinomycetota bacterium]|nr:glycosyltransferase family 2 protein [Actinomycetota bacterium]
MKIAAIVPAFNEEARVGHTVRALIGTRSIDEVVVVDDGSRDRTADVAQAAGARVIRLKKNLGKAAAVTGGVAATNADVLLLCDADLEDSATALVALLDPVVDGEVHMAIAAPPRSAPSGFGLVESAARWGLCKITGRRFDRPLSGQRALLREAWPALRPVSGFGFEVGLTIDVLRNGFRVVEVPCMFTHAHTGRDLAGFTHRGRQGAAVARALVSRLRPHKVGAS